VAIAIGALLALGIILVSVFDWNHARPALAKLLSTRIGRPVSINGDLRVHPWSWNPSLEVGGLAIRNPPWAGREYIFRARDLRVSVSLGRLLRGQLLLPEVSVFDPVIDVERDADGQASWNFGGEGAARSPERGSPRLPSIRRLILRDGRVRVVDAIRKLNLEGSISATDDAGRAGASQFELRCQGSLNAKPFELRFDGGPLVNVTPDSPYRFKASMQASDTHLDAEVSIPKPFDLGAWQARLHLSGADLADGYYLTGLALPNTGRYELSGDLEHQGSSYRIAALSGRVGSSDLAGELQVTTGTPRPLLRAELHSRALALADLAPTLGHAAAPSGPAASNAGGLQRAGSRNTPTAPRAADTLLPDADLQVERVRGMDADVTYAAGTFAASRLPLRALSFHLRLDGGVLQLDPLSFELDQGRFTGSVSIDARTTSPESRIDMTLSHVDLGEFKSAAATQGPVQGELRGHVAVHGRGTSVHKLAAHAEGTVSFAIPHGQMRDVLAELTGINVLRGLGLLVSRNEVQTDIRCGVADFQAHDGVLTADSVFVDTTDVLITGRGDIRLAGEQLNLSLQGDPKKLRFIRLRSPIALEGTFLHPIIALKPTKLLAQAGAAVALGTLLTPFAAALAFIDPGLAKDQDCAAVMAQWRESAAARTASAPDSTR
jgi:uncharacterized protein involved in outer membrane biogenesis